MNELKPCPFCGLKDLKVDFDSNSIECQDCGGGVRSEDVMYIYKAWNTRGSVLEDEYDVEPETVKYKCNRCGVEAVGVAYSYLGLNCECDKKYGGCGAIYPIEFNEDPKLELHRDKLTENITPETKHQQ